MLCAFMFDFHIWLLSQCATFFLFFYFLFFYVCQLVTVFMFFSVNLNLPGVNLCIDPGLTPPTELQMLQLRKIVATGLADHVAR